MCIIIICYHHLFGRDPPAARESESESRQSVIANIDTTNKNT